MPVKTHLTIGVLVFTALLRGESYIPAAQGPPVATPANAKEFGVSGYLTVLLKGTIEAELIKINAALAARTDVRAKVELSPPRVYSPFLSSTQFSDRPNHVFAWVMYMLEFKVTNIKYYFAGGWRSYPWNRKVSMGVEARTFCDGWERGAGRIKIVIDPNPPYLDPNPSYSEAIVNFFMGSVLVPFVNAQVSNAMTSSNGASITLPEDRAKCVSIGAASGDPYILDDDYIFWNNPGNRTPPFTLPITVRPVSVKRLNAHRPDGTSLYDVIESPALDLWAGFARWYHELPPMAEGQVVLLPAPAIQVYPRPANGAQLLVLANLSQSSLIDSNFKLFPSSANFGNGTQKLIIYKTYWQPPGPPLYKPIPFAIAAYEITFEVSAPGIPTVPVSFQ